MRDTRRKIVLLDQLESRSLLSTVAGTVFSAPQPGSAVQADIAKINADQQKLRADTMQLAPTIRQDLMAINAAVASSQGVQIAQHKVNADQDGWWRIIQADVIVVEKATTRAIQTTAVNKIQADIAAAGNAYKVDMQAVQTAINNDPLVQAAKGKLATDCASLTADRAALAADYAQLRKDLMG